MYRGEELTNAVIELMTVQMMGDHEDTLKKKMDELKAQFLPPEPAPPQEATEDAVKAQLLLCESEGSVPMRPLFTTKTCIVLKCAMTL